MSCFNNRSSSNIFDSCCNGSTLCEFDGCLDNVTSVPVFVQMVYDAVQSNLQGMRSVQNQTFTPCIPCGYTISKVCDIRAKAFFNPANVDDPRNLNVDIDTTLSGASFLENCHGDPVTVPGPDGMCSQKILFADNTHCEDTGRGTQIFGTQTVKISGSVQVFIDLILCNNCNHETKFTVCADVPVATVSNPLMLTNFFEVCMPSETDTAFLPRFTELIAVKPEVRLATNNCGRDLNIDPDGRLTGNLIVALCISAEKKVIAPVQMCVLSTGMADIPSQHNSVCSGFPSMAAGSISVTEKESRCGCGNDDDDWNRNNSCGCNSDDSGWNRHDSCNCHDHHNKDNCCDPCDTAEYHIGHSGDCCNNGCR